MELEQIAAIAEIVGAVAVVVSIAYLAFQMRQNTVAIRAQALIARTTEIDQSLREFALSPDLADIYHRLETEGASSLSEVEKQRAMSWERAKIQRLSAQMYLWEHGLLDEDEYLQLERVAIGSNDRLWKPLGLNVTITRLVKLLEVEGA